MYIYFSEILACFSETSCKICIVKGCLSVLVCKMLSKEKFTWYYLIKRSILFRSKILAFLYLNLSNLQMLKVAELSVSDILTIFFHEWNPPGLLVNRLKWFFRKICFRRDIQFLISKNLIPLSVACTESTFFWPASPVKKLYKNVGPYWNSSQE